MGVGKSTVGKKLAALSNRIFLDTDQELIRRTGVTISYIFDVEGEEGFRDRETCLLKEVCRQASAVIATGGGSILRARNRALMKETGLVVHLDLPMDALWERLKHSTHRPLLSVENPRAKLEQLQAERQALYQQMADYRVVPTAASTAADQIWHWLITEKGFES